MKKFWLVLVICPFLHIHTGFWLVLVVRIPPPAHDKVLEAKAEQIEEIERGHAAALAEKDASHTQLLTEALKVAGAVKESYSAAAASGSYQYEAAAAVQAKQHREALQRLVDEHTAAIASLKDQHAKAMAAAKVSVQIVEQ